MFDTILGLLPYVVIILASVLPAIRKFLFKWYSVLIAISVGIFYAIKFTDRIGLLLSIGTGILFGVFAASSVACIFGVFHFLFSKKSSTQSN